jgi:hypothetical protein
VEQIDSEKSIANFISLLHTLNMEFAAEMESNGYKKYEIYWMEEVGRARNVIVFLWRVFE